MAAGSPVNPFLAHSAEPAPMGVADFGVTGTGAGSSAYQYTTSAFQGSAKVQSMHLSWTSGSTTFKVAAFELNAIVVLRLGGTNYSYWIQNGLHVDTSTNEYTIGGAYVWNFSSPTARLSTGELRGNAASVLVTDTYYFIPGCGGFAGQCSTLTLPANLTARIVLSTCAGYPCVQYEYDLGSGWVTYDNVSFLHMADATEVGFVVDGFQYAPIATGVFYDAEWDWVAAGGGHAGRDDGSSFQMALDLWDGRGYVPVPSAWNFGGDTGESSYNVTEALADPGPFWAPAGDLASGAGKLGVVYNQSTVGFVNVTVPFLTAGNLTVDGAPVLYPGGSLNLSLTTGPHTVTLLNYWNASAQVIVGPGTTGRVDFSGAGRTVFQQVGLPSTIRWGVSVDGNAGAGTGPFVTLNLPNGTYPISISRVPGYYLNATDPATVDVPARLAVEIAWSPVTFKVPIAETGLPTGTSWWVNASGVVVRGTAPTLNLAEPNGSTSFTAGSSFEFLASPASGVIQVVGGVPAPVSVQFSYRATFIAGTVSPDSVQVSINGSSVTVSGGGFNESVFPGTYTLVAEASGYASQTLTVVATPGNVTFEQIILVATGSSGPIAPAAGSSGIGTTALVGIAVVVIAVAGAAVVIVQRRKNESR